MSLPKYQSHKVVEAFKIEQIEQGPRGTSEAVLRGQGHHVTVPAEYMMKHGPQIGGYFVRYPGDGYESWSPAQAFEAGYTRVEEPAAAPPASPDKGEHAADSVTEAFAGPVDVDEP